MAKLSLKEKMAQLGKKQTKKFEEPSGGGMKDPKKFIISKDSDGGGTCLVRLLPFVREDGSYDTFVSRKYHSIDNFVNGNKRWMSETCLAQKGDDCPLCEEAWDRYNTAKEELGKEGAKDYLKNTNNTEYYINVLVVEDKINPSNEGKVFYMRFGKFLKDLMESESSPSEEEIKEKGYKPFIIADLFESYPLRLTLSPKEKGKFQDWKASYFVRAESGIKDITEDLINIAKSSNPEIFDGVDNEDEKVEIALQELCIDIHKKFYLGDDCLTGEELMAKFYYVMGESEGDSNKPSGTRGLPPEKDEKSNPVKQMDEEIEKEKEVVPEKKEPITEPQEEIEEKEVQEEKPSGSGTDDIDDFLNNIG